MRPNFLLSTVIVSFAVAGISALHAQTALPSASPAASLAADPSSAAASPTPLVVNSAVGAPVPNTKKRVRQASPEMLEKYDANKNGRIDPEEKQAMKKDRAARHAERLKKYDKNGDGKLDETEKSVMKADKKAGKGL